MKIIPVLCLLPLAGCGMVDNLTAFVAAGANVASLMTIQRTPADAVYSLVTDRDCSVARLDSGKSYCRRAEPPPGAPPYCTRSLGAVDCWRDEGSVPGQHRGVADGPALTPEQEANRLRGWP
jgi:hypothetical protein